MKGTQLILVQLSDVLPIEYLVENLQLMELITNLHLTVHQITSMEV